MPKAHFYHCPASLTLAALAIVFVTGLLVTGLNGILGRYAKAQRAGWSEVNRVFDELVQGIETLKMQAAEGRQSGVFERHAAALQRLAVRAGAILAGFSPGIELLSKLGGLCLVALAYLLISQGKIERDPFLLFFFYATLLQMSVAQLTRLLADIQTELTGLTHLAGFFAEPLEAEEEGLAAESLPARPPAIELRGVTFGYAGKRRLYTRANMLIPAGSVTLVHGESGSGKSTLINLLMRFYPPDEGNILIGGVDLRHVPRKELRSKIGVITQQHFIFQESLRANLLIARANASDKELLEAIERARLGEFLARLPQGLDTVMDPRGQGISAGEKQRICIARLLLRASPVMILDEPWSNLDIGARTLLARVINSCKTTATVLILTHESLPALAVDKVYRLDGSRGIFIEEDPACKDGGSLATSR